MVAVARSLVSETAGFLVNHYGSSFEDFLGGDRIQDSICNKSSV